MQNNPYDILGVSPSASKAEITKALARAMQRKQYPVDVIAKAQKSLMKPDERIIADYLRPVLPPIKRFKYSDLSALLTPIPKLTLLAEFDGLDQAIADSLEAELREQEPLPQTLSELLTVGMTACKEGNYPEAIQYLQAYCDTCDQHDSKDYMQAQIWLIKAYEKGGQLSRAIALCESLVTHSHPQVQNWAKKSLPLLTKETNRV